MTAEFLLCGAPPTMLAQALEPRVLVFDPSRIHRRIIEANDAEADATSLRVPVVPASVWTRLFQIVSRQRARAVRWAVASEDLELFVPLWQHLMPAAQVLHGTADELTRAMESA